MTSQGPMERAVAEAFKAAQIPPTDNGGKALARRYAQLLDAARGGETEDRVYDSLGPKLLAALTALGLTKTGRGASAKGGEPVATPAAAVVDQLAQRRRDRRQH